MKSLNKFMLVLIFPPLLHLWIGFLLGFYVAESINEFLLFSIIITLFYIVVSYYYLKEAKEERW